MDEVIRRIGRQIRSKRKLLGLTQRDLAARAGVNSGLIGDIEQGKKPMQAVRTLFKIAQAMSLSVEDLMGSQQDVDPEDLLLREIVYLMRDRSFEDRRFIVQMIRSFLAHMEQVTRLRGSPSEPSSLHPAPGCREGTG